MMEPLILLLVFSAVALGVWTIIPLLVDAGMWRTDLAVGGQVVSSDGLHLHAEDSRVLLQSCWAVALLAGGIVASVVLATGFLGVMGSAIAAVVVGAIGFQLPRTLARRRFRIRQQLFQARLMDLTLGLANGLRSGASLPQTLELVTRDIGGPMGEEFSVVLQEYRLGIDLPEALQRLCRRMPGEDLTLLMSAVRLTMQAGGSLAEVLDKITGTIRERTEFQEKLLTMTAQGKFEAIAMASAPAVVFLLLYWVDPNLMKPLVHTHMGLAMLALVLVMETIGFFFINRIVTIEV